MRFSCVVTKIRGDSLVKKHKLEEDIVKVTPALIQVAQLSYGILCGTYVSMEASLDL